MFGFGNATPVAARADEVTFLEKHKGISRGDAIKLFLEMAGVNGEASTSKSASPLDWRACVKAFSQKHLERLARGRGYSIELCAWLKEAALVGLYDECIAFPVHDRAGNVIAAHYHVKDGSWRYSPTGTKTRPLVIGELLPGAHPFES